jgi:concentrative nucleoside transporter, CNT family
MSELRGAVGLVVIIGVAILASNRRSRIPWRTVAVGLFAQVAFAVLVLRWSVGKDALDFVAGQVEALIHYTDAGIEFLFGRLVAERASEEESTIFALQVLPVIIFIGALVGLLFYLRVIQWIVEIVGGAIAWAMRTTKVESLYAATVIFLGQSEAPLMIQSYLSRLTRSELFVVMTAGFASVAGSTLVGYALLGAPLPFLLAATVMNAPGALYMAKIMFPETEQPESEADVRNVRDTESANVIDATARGAISGGRIAVIVGCLLIAFISLIALANGLLGGVGEWFGYDDLTFQKVLGWAFAPVAWLIGVPWDEAAKAGTFLGEKTVLNEFVAYADFGPQVKSLSDQTVVVVTFALAGFANFSSIAIQIGAIGGLAPDRRGEVAQFGLRALLAGSLVNLANAAIAGIVAS